MRRFCGCWWGGGLVLVVLCLAVYLPGLMSIPPVDRDESRFAQASRQMIESGDYVVPRVQDRPRLNKPPLIYWLQCGSIAVFGDRAGQYPNANIWVFRVPSVLSAMAAMLLTWRLGVRMFDARAGLLGGAMLAVCPMVVWDAHQARADQLLLACTTGAMCALWCVWKQEARDRSRERRRARLWLAPTAFWLMTGLGILAKGPITPLVAGLTVLAVSLATHRWRWVMGVRPMLGVLIVSAFVGPWVWAVGKRVGWQTYLSTVFDETIGRSGGAKEGHWGPPGYHLVVLVVLFWPGVLMTAAAVGRAVRRVWPANSSRYFGIANEPPGTLEVRARAGFWGTLRGMTARTDSVRPELFLLCWILPSWLVFELIATKLPHYTLPMYPAIALLSARGIFAAVSGALDHALLDRPAASSESAWAYRAEVRIGFYVWLIVGIAATAFAVYTTYNRVPHGIQPHSTLMALLAAVVVFCVNMFLLFRAFRAIERRRYLPAMTIAIVVSALAGNLFLFQGARVALPGAQTVNIFNRLAELDPTATRPLATEYHEDSLIFWTRGRVQRINRSDRESWFAKHPAGIAVLALTYEESSNPVNDARLAPYTRFSIVEHLPAKQTD